MKIGILTADPTNNISFYRATGPLSKLPDTKIDIIENLADINSCDAILITCPYTMVHIEFIRMCKEAGKKVWLDFDDLITEISPWNERAFLEYSQHPVKEVVIKAISQADFVTVSTHKLEKEFGCLSDHVYTVENAWDDEFLPFKEKFGTKNEVLYRGGRSHELDLWTYRNSILGALKGSNWKPHFLGMNPIFINMELNGTWTPQLSKPDYWKFLGETCESKILIVPLRPSAFSHGKSCIAWLEGTYAGCAVLAPDWYEWKKPGIINYSNGADFERKLKGMMSGRIDLKEKVQNSREYIKACQTLGKVNETRVELINKYLR